MTTFSNKFILPLNKTVKTGKKDKKNQDEKERRQVGYAMIAYPSLADFGIVAEVEQKDGKPVIGEDGVPVYVKAEMDWLQQAITSAVSAKVRNYFVSSIKAQPETENKDTVLGVDSGKTLPTDFEMLTAESTRSGEALALRREARADFEAYLGAQSKTQAVIQALGELFFNSGRVLGSASPKYVQALGQHAEAWTKQLDTAKTTRFAPKIVELGESINAAIEKDELDLS